MSAVSWGDGREWSNSNKDKHKLFHSSKLLITKISGFKFSEKKMLIFHTVESKKAKKTWLSL